MKAASTLRKAVITWVRAVLQKTRSSNEQKAASARAVLQFIDEYKEGGPNQLPKWLPTSLWRMFEAFHAGYVADPGCRCAAAQALCAAMAPCSLTICLAESMHTTATFPNLLTTASQRKPSLHWSCPSTPVVLRQSHPS